MGYDPNEETRLKTVIRAIGDERFNLIIRKLAVAINVNSHKPPVVPTQSVEPRSTTVFGRLSGECRGQVSDIEVVPCTSSVGSFRSSATGSQPPDSSWGSMHDASNI